MSRIHANRKCSHGWMMEKEKVFSLQRWGFPIRPGGPDGVERLLLLWSHVVTEVYLEVLLDPEK